MMKNIDEYMMWTRTTVKYSATIEALYLAHGLPAEVGELAGNLAKFYRGDFDHVELKERNKKELGDILWFICRIIDNNGWTVSEILDGNMGKLRQRLESNTIKGDGEDRNIKQEVV